MVTLQLLSEVAKTFNERHGDLFEVWEVNINASDDRVNEREVWLLIFGSMKPGQEGDDLLLMGDLGITHDTYSNARTPCLGRCPPNPTVDQIVETMFKVSMDYWVVQDVQES